MFAAELKEKLKGFACHWFNVHANHTFDQAVAGMSDKAIIKIQDFSENYICLLPEEIMSIHWTQRTSNSLSSSCSEESWCYFVWGSFHLYKQRPNTWCSFYWIMQFHDSYILWWEQYKYRNRYWIYWWLCKSV